MVAPGASTGYAETYYEDDGQPVAPHVYEAVSADDAHCKHCGQPWLKGPHLAPAHEEDPPEEKYSTAGNGPKSGVYDSPDAFKQPVPDETLTNDKPELDDPPAKPKNGKKHK